MLKNQEFWWKLQQNHFFFGKLEIYSILTYLVFRGIIKLNIKKNFLIRSQKIKNLEENNNKLNNLVFYCIYAAK